MKKRSQKALHNFYKRRQHSIVEPNISLEYALDLYTDMPQKTLGTTMKGVTEINLNNYSNE